MIKEVRQIWTEASRDKRRLLLIMSIALVAMSLAIYWGLVTGGTNPFLALGLTWAFTLPAGWVAGTWVSSR